MEITRLETLTNLVINLSESIDIIADTYKAYHEVTSINNIGYRYLKQYNIDFRYGDLVYIMKKVHIDQGTSHVKEIKFRFDKHILRNIKFQSSVVDSGDMFYHFRPTRGSKLWRELKDFTATNTGQSALGILGSIIGIPGISTYVKPITNLARDFLNKLKD